MKLKAIFHIDEREKWQLTLNNVHHLIKAAEDAGKAIEIEVLANAAAVKDLVNQPENPYGEKMNAQAERNVRFAVCSNALMGHDIKPDTLFDFAVVVPAGVLELIERQADGFGYIKP